MDKGERNDDESADWEVDVEAPAPGNVRGKGSTNEGTSNDAKLREAHHDSGVCWPPTHGY